MQNVPCIEHCAICTLQNDRCIEHHARCTEQNVDGRQQSVLCIQQLARFHKVKPAHVGGYGEVMVVPSIVRNSQPPGRATMVTAPD